MVAALQMGLFDPLPEPSWLDDLDSEIDQLLGIDPDGLRWFQREAYDALLTSFADNQSALVVMATGLGKTRLFSTVAKYWKGRVLMLAHRKELIQNGRDAMEFITGEFTGIEQGERWSERSDRLVVGSIQTLYQEGRIERLLTRGAFDLVIADEAHHWTAAKYKGVLDKVKASGAKVLGVTATPDRSDGRALGQVFDDVAYTMDIQDGIEDGSLVPISLYQVVLDEITLDQVKASKKGDLNVQMLDEEMLKAAKHIVSDTLRLYPDRRGPVFLPGKQSAMLVCEEFNLQKPGCAVCVTDDTPETIRDNSMAAVKRGDIQFLCNVQIATEGFDWPEADIVVLGRPTKSRALYAQMCLDETTEILTKEGWLGIDDNRTGVEVAAFDLDSEAVHWEAPSEWVDRPLLPGESFRGIENPGLSICVTDNHNMVIRSRHGRAKRWSPWRLCRADVVPWMFEIPVSGNQSFPGLPLTDDELLFLGLLMTDGHVAKSGQATLYQSARYPSIVAEIERLLSCLCLRNKRRTDSGPTNFGTRRHMMNIWGISYGEPRRRSERHLRGWGYLEKYYSKELPNILDEMTGPQFEAFVHGLWLGDGYKMDCVTEWEPSTWSICTSRKMFADRLQSMAVRRGWRCNVSREGGIYKIHLEPEKSGRSVSTTASDGRPLFGVRSSGNRVWCCTVSTGAIITRRNGKVAVVGNCGRGTRVLPKTIDHIRGKQKAAERRQAVLESRKPNLVVLDFVGATSVHDLASIVDILGGKYKQATVKRVKERMQLEPGLDVRQALEDTEKELLAAAELRAMAESHKAQIKSRVIEASPFKVLKLDEKAQRQYDTRYGFHSMTEGQRRLLEKWGLPAADIKKMSKRAAHVFISENSKRRERGMATFGMLKQIQRFVQPPGEVTKAQADRAFEYIKGKDWGRKPIDQAMLLELLSG